MMTDEYVTASDLKAIEQRVNREAQQTMQHLMTLQKRIDELSERIESVDTVTNNVIDKVIRNVHRIETMVNEIEGSITKEPDAVKSLVNLSQMLLALQARVHALEMKDHYKDPTQQSVADFERSQSLNALNQKADSDAKCSSETLRPDPNWAWFDTSKWDQKPTPADLESEIAKSFMEWLRTEIPNSGLFSAFQAGVKFGMSKPLPNPTP